MVDNVYGMNAAANHYKVIGYVRVYDKMSRCKGNKVNYNLSFTLIDNADGSNMTDVYYLSDNGKTYKMTATGDLFSLIYQVVNPLLSQDPNKKYEYNGKCLDVFLYTYDGKKLTWNNNNGNSKAAASDKGQKLYSSTMKKIESIKKFLFNSCAENYTCFNN